MLHTILSEQISKNLSSLIISYHIFHFRPKLQVITKIRSSFTYNLYLISSFSSQKKILLAIPSLCSIRRLITTYVLSKGLGRQARLVVLVNTSPRLSSVLVSHTEQEHACSPSCEKTTVIWT